MIDWATCEAVERHPQRFSGAWVFRGTRILFRGTRIPISSLFENLEADVSVSEFVEAFEGVAIEQVRAVLEHVARSPLAPA
jgi:uncharacterized protein (DUF433 family)